MTRASSLTDWTWVRVKSIGTLGGAVLFLVESLGVTIWDFAMHLDMSLDMRMSIGFLLSSPVSAGELARRKPGDPKALKLLRLSLWVIRADKLV